MDPCAHESDVVDLCHNVHPIYDHLLSARPHTLGKLLRDVLRAIFNVSLHEFQGQGKLLLCPVDVFWLSDCLPLDCCPPNWVFGGHETPEEATSVSSGAEFHKGVDDFQWLAALSLVWRGNIAALQRIVCPFFWGSFPNR